MAHPVRGKATEEKHWTIR